MLLEILKQADVLSMSLSERMDAASTLKHYSKVSFSLAEIEKACQEVVFILNKAGKIGALDQSSYKGLKKVGQLLWDHLLSKPVKDKLKSLPSQSLILSIDEELIHIPWELLFDGNDFLCLKFSLGRLVRTGERPSSLQCRAFTSVPRMLILANPTADLKSSYQEGLSLKNQFDRRRDIVHIDFKSTAIDRYYVKKNLCDYDIVHFAGHCEYEADDLKRSGWVLSDGRFSTQDIMAAGESISMPALVFSNACYSAKADTELLEADYQEKNYNFAGAFLFAGVRHYIGSISKIEDSLGKAFALEFYTQLIAGKPVGEAVRLSRLKMIEDSGNTALGWFSYLLYGDPNYVLFKGAAQAVHIRQAGRKLLAKKLLIAGAAAAGVIALGFYLSSWLPSINPKTYAVFAKAQRLFSDGSNDEVVLLSCSLIKSDPFFLKTYPQLAQTYLRQGDFRRALQCYFDYALNSEKKRNLKQLAEAYIGVGWIYYLTGESQKSVDFYRKALLLSKENKDKLHEAVALRKIALWHIDRQENDLALEFLMKSSEINRDRRRSWEHHYNLACDYFDIALVFTNKDDYAAAKEFYEKSRGIFENMRLKSELSDYYFNLGEICLFEKQYLKALEWYRKGIKVDEQHDNKLSLASDYNMLGELYVEMGKMDEAASFFDKAFMVAKGIGLQPELGIACLNLARLYKNIGDLPRARQYLKEAQGLLNYLDVSTQEEVRRALLDLGPV